MRRRIFTVLLAASLSAIVAGCAAHNANHRFEPFDLTPAVLDGTLLQKADAFMIILDESGSMLEPYAGVSGPPVYRKNMFGFQVRTPDPFQGKARCRFARETARRISKTIPDIPLLGAVRTFGTSRWPWESRTNLIYGITKYSREDADAVIKNIHRAGGRSALGMALHAAGRNMANVSGRMAVIVLSDGLLRNDDPVSQAEDLDRKYGDRLCIHTVCMGKDRFAVRKLEEVARASGCGFSVKAEDLITPEQIADFVTRIFLEKAPEQPLADDDGDGVPNVADACPDTPRETADRRGCPKPPDAQPSDAPDIQTAAAEASAGEAPDARIAEEETPVSEVQETPAAEKETPGSEAPETPAAEKETPVSEAPAAPAARTRIEYEPSGIKAILFSPEKWRLHPLARPHLDDVATRLGGHPGLILEIRGHADNIEPSPEALSQKRAAAVRDYLIETGIAPDRISAVGFGAARPRSDNASSVGRALNRRVAFWAAGRD